VPKKVEKSLMVPAKIKVLKTIFSPLDFRYIYPYITFNLENLGAGNACFLRILK
jgi:hypothetical protein